MEIAIIVGAVLLTVVMLVAGFIFIRADKFKGGDYTIPELDLSVQPEETKNSEYEYLYRLSVVDDSKDYMAHPDSVLLKDESILTVYPAGHGKGAVLNKLSKDGGISWSETVENTPKSWEKSLETPTVYRLQFRDENVTDKLILISANSKWTDVSAITWQTPWPIRTSIATFGFCSFLYARSTIAPAILSAILSG